MDTTLQDPLIGRLLDGRYRIEQRIAVGGMATVYRATDARLDRVVALKVMHPALAANAGSVDRFIREARSTARLDHPNIVGVLDQGTDGGYVYLAMEYVAGCTLRDVLGDRGALPPRAVLDIVEPMLAGLAAAHRAGLIHRDIKPENVLIGDDGRVKVADFGLVRAVDPQDGQTSTSTDSVLGTLSYLSPEQIEGGTVDARTDVYACGVLLYELLTGRKPYTGETAARVLYAHVNEDMPLPSQEVEGLAPELDGLVARAAARDPERRPADAAALLSLVRAVRAVLSDTQLDTEPGPAAPGEAGPEDRTRVVPLPKGVRATAPDGRRESTARIQVPLLPPYVAEEEFESEGLPPRRRMPRRRVLTLVGAVLLLIGIGLGVWYINSGQFLQTPGVYGLSQAEAEERLRDAGLRVEVEHDVSETVEPGHVIISDPERGDRVRRNSTVTIVVSDGPPVAVVPDLRGSGLADAKEQLREAGLTPGEEIWEYSATVPRGSVIETRPGHGEERRPNSAVDLVLSRGAEVAVPDVVGLPEAQAKQRLRAEGFLVTIAEETVHSEEEAGTVAEQSPGADETAAAGERITLTLSSGPELVVVPDVRGESVDEATEILEDAGFEVNVNQFFFAGDVWNQSVHGGDRAPRGSTITLWVR